MQTVLTQNGKSTTDKCVKMQNSEKKEAYESEIIENGAVSSRCSTVTLGKLGKHGRNGIIVNNDQPQGNVITGHKFNATYSSILPEKTLSQPLTGSAHLRAVSVGNTICKNNVRVIPISTSSQIKISQSKTPVSINGSISVSQEMNISHHSNSKDDVLKTPTSISGSEPRKRVKISTVSKMVPLLNTVGNQSKLLVEAIAAHKLQQSSATTHGVPSTSSSHKKDLETKSDVPTSTSVKILTPARKSASPMVTHSTSIDTKGISVKGTFWTRVSAKESQFQSVSADPSDLASVSTSATELASCSDTSKRAHLQSALSKGLNSKNDLMSANESDPASLLVKENCSARESGPINKPAEKIQSGKILLEKTLSSTKLNTSSVPQINSFQNPNVRGVTETYLKTQRVSVRSSDTAVNNLAETTGTIQKSMRPGRKLTVVFNYEKGPTKSVEVKPRTVVMVDASTQASLPQSEAQVTRVMSVHPENMSHLSASSESTGFAQHFVTSTSINPRPITVVNSANGKKFYALPKQIIQNYSGSQILNGGKQIICDSGFYNDSVLKGLKSGHTVLHPPSVKSQLSSSIAPSVAQVKSSINPLHSKVDRSDNDSNVANSSSSLSFKAVATSSCQGFSSSASPSPSLPVISLSLSNHEGTSHELISEASQKPVENSGAVAPVTSSSFPDMSNESHVITTDSLVLPLNSPIKVNGKQLGFDADNSMILPLDSVIPVSDASSHSIPNSMSLVMIMPSKVNEISGESLLESRHLNVCGSSRLLKDSQLKRNGETSSNEAPPVKKMCSSYTQAKLTSQSTPKPDFTTLEPSQSYESQSVGATSSGSQFIHDSPKNKGLTSTVRRIESSISTNSYGDRSIASKEEVAKIVKNAFEEFKSYLNANVDGNLPIHVAVESNDYSAVKRQCIILQARKSSVNIRNSMEETPLQMALSCGFSDIAKLLLDYGADGRVFDQDGNSTLHLTVMHAEDALESLLLKSQFNIKFVNHLNDEGFSALHLAAQYNKVEAIKLLIKHEAVVDLPDGKSGRTALFHAAERKQYEAQRTLVSYGANMNVPTFTGSTPFLITRSELLVANKLQAMTTNMVGEEVDIETLLRPSKHLQIIH